jgi:hypothetical protein
MMRWLTLLMVVCSALPARAQIPSEWEGAAQVVLNELDRDTPQVTKQWGPELRQGWNLARSWRQHNNGNIEIILAEYLTFTALCRAPGCGGSTVEGKPFADMAQQVRTLRAEQGSPYTLATNAHAWLAGLADPSGAAAKNAALWARDLDIAAADFATGNLYALTWLLARSRPTPAEQASTFARFAIFVQGKAWIGDRCLDISRVAAVIDAPPRVEVCK